MPTETDLIEQLKDYGTWLEGDLGTELACESSDVTLMDTGPATWIAESVPVDEVVATPRRWPSALALVASALLVVGGIALLSTRASDPAVTEPAVVTIDESPTTSTRQPQRSTPDGQSTGSVRPEAMNTPSPLFLLPASLGGLRSFDSSFDEVPSGDTGSAIVVGRPETNGLSEVSAIAFLEELSFAGDQGEIEIDGRVVQVANDSDIGPAVIGIPVEGGGWLEISAATEDLRDGLLNAVSIDSGEIVFAPFDGIDVISTVDQLEAIRARFVFLGGDADGDIASVIVHSHPGDTGLPGFSGLGDLERVQIRGREGYRQTLITELGVPATIVTWQEEPGQVVTVLGAGSLDAIELAEGLRVVDEETWFSEVAALETIDPFEVTVGYPVGTFTLIDDQGAEVVFQPDGSPVVLVAGSCAECLVDPSEVSERVSTAAPNARFAVVFESPAAEEERPPGWSGPVYSLDSNIRPAGFSLADSFDPGHALVLDGENTTVARLDLSQPEVLGQLDLILASLS